MQMSRGFACASLRHRNPPEFINPQRRVGHFVGSANRSAHAANYRVDISFQVQAMDKLSVVNDFTKCKIQKVPAVSPRRSLIGCTPEMNNSLWEHHEASRRRHKGEPLDFVNKLADLQIEMS